MLEPQLLRLCAGIAWLKSLACGIYFNYGSKMFWVVLNQVCQRSEHSGEALGLWWAWK